MEADVKTEKKPQSRLDAKYREQMERIRWSLEYARLFGEPA